MEWYFEDNGERQGPLDDAGLEQARRGRDCNRRNAGLERHDE